MLRDLTHSEKPREKLQSIGEEHLTDIELLAILLRTGTREKSALDLARAMLLSANGLKNLLNMTLQEMQLIPGVGLAKACSIKASLEIIKRLENVKSTKVKLSSPDDSYKFLRQKMYAKSEEHLFLTSLDAKQKVISCDLVTKGTVNSSLINPREIFRLALKRNAVFIILAHNHPSNETIPSANDIQVTQAVAEAGQRLGIPLLDHLIITDFAYVSLKNYL